MDRRHICHITLLNPALHSRIFFKEALSQAKAGFRVTIIGQHEAASPFEKQGIRIIPTGVFGRNSWKRVFIRKRIRREALRSGAGIFQVHTPELLGVALKLKAALPGSAVIYDMHEDYAANVLHGGTYSASTRNMLAKSIRNMELQAVQSGIHVIYAEKCYDNILQVPVDRYCVAANKYAAPSEIIRPGGLPDRPFLLHTGTLARTWGVFRAIEIWRELRLSMDVALVVAGHGQDKRCIAEIRETVRQAGLGQHFYLIGGENYLPFEQIVWLEQNCLAAFALYEVRENIADRIPTKFYEMMAHRKPVLFTSHAPWNRLNEQYQFGIPVPAREVPFREIAAALTVAQSHFYQKPLPEEAWSWNTEKENMLQLLHRISSLP